MSEKRKLHRQRLSMKEKNSNSKQWYKDQADLLDNEHHTLHNTYDGHNSEYSRMKINYDLFNNILNLDDFQYVCKPFGENAGELPAQMVNRDISSGKIKAILGMEMARPFSYKVVATNKEATTRREQEETKKLRDYVVEYSMQDIRLETEKKYLAETKGRELTPEEQQKIQQQIEEEIKQKTPENVRRYMEREYQDPAEVLSHQLLEYHIKKQDIKKKFNEVFKHMTLSSKELMYVGIMNDEPVAWVVNPMRFNSDTSSDNMYVEDGEFATMEYRMLPSEVATYFGEDFTETELDDIYSNYAHYKTNRIKESLFEFDDYSENDENTIRVLHCVWKSLREIHFLSYRSKETGEIKEMIVDEDYELSPQNGDLFIETEWIPEVYETWKVGTDKYAKMRPVPGQLKDIDNLYACKLPYYGIECDNMNSVPTSLMDRLKNYQYYFNIVMFRLEMLLATDKGKKILMNLNLVPDSAGIDMEKWQYLSESTPYMWYDPTEEGNTYTDANTVAKVIDLSLASDIGKYIELAEYLKRQCGESVGITPEVEGQIGQYQAAQNAQQAIVQSSHILEPYFDLHNSVKKNVLTAILECAKVAYSNKEPFKLTYVLDDMSKKMIEVNPELLDSSTLGLFVSNSSQSEKVMNTINQLAHAAVQNQTVEFSDIVTILNQTGSIEAEESLKAAEEVRRQHELLKEREKGNAIKEQLDKQEEHAKAKHEREKELVILKEEERRKTEVIKSSIMGASFNPDQDVDNDGENDFVELAKNGLEADIKREKNQIDREKLQHQKEKDKRELDIKEKELSIKKQQNKAKT